jgi:16S rRNA (guanine527-N7)-methyltransferase
VPELNQQEAQAREAIVATGHVSRETLLLLERYVDMLRHWQSRTNLVATSTLDEIWSRHILDSAQLLRLQPEARLWVDLGSGGGLPGLVLGCAMRPLAGHVHLVESNGKKASFLRHVATSLALPCTVHAKRIEMAMPDLPVPQVVTARALASLDQLLALANSLLKNGAVGLFPKGRDYQTELTQASERWHFNHVLHASLTDPKARLIGITGFRGPKGREAGISAIGKG